MSGSNALTIPRDPTVLVNPLAAEIAGTQAAGQVYDLRQKQATEAAGQAYQGAINPQTGEFDPNEFRRRLAASGPAAMAAGHELTNTQNISSDQLKQNLEKAKWVNSTAGAALLQGDYSDATMLGLLHRGVAGGILTLPEAQKQLADMPPDAAGRKRWLEEHRDTSGSYVEQTQTQYGAPGSEIDPTGRRVGTVQQSPRFGGGISAQPQAGVPLGLTPNEATALDKVDIGNGQTIQVPHGLVPGLLATNPGWRAIVAPTATAPSGAPNATVAPPPPPQGAVVRPSPASAPATAAAPVVSAAPTAPAPTLGVSAAPGAVPAAQKTGEQSAAMGAALTTRADQVPTNKANYANMLTDLSKLDTMGPGTEKEVALNAAMQKLTGYGFSMNREQVAAGNSFAKLANIAVGQQLQSIGGTDARQALFMGSNPHLDLSKLGNQQIIHMLQGNEDAIQAKSRAWQDWQKGGKGTDTYAAFQDDFNHHFDPRVFQQRYMGPSEVTSLRKSLTNEGNGATQKFLDDVQYARKQGWIQ